MMMMMTVIMVLTVIRMEQERREADESGGGKRCKEGVQHSVQETHGTVQAGTSRTLCVSGVL